MNETNTQKGTKDDSPKRPLTFIELVRIVLSGHLGVRKRVQRVSDFDRANGLHVFLAAALYFALIVTGLIVLVSYIAT
tara:strand:+ start:1428 stop:1661 length:234 start_codon:yes stop_codon:yes gene_type:complete